MEKTSSKSLTQAIYEQLRHEVLTCQIRPGSRVNVKEVCDRLGASLGAVREAFSRLTSDGLVYSEPQKGFSITPISLDDLRDLTAVRIDIEGSCLRQSIEHGDVSWEAGLLASYHLLSKVALQKDVSVQSQLDWNLAHNGFHEALVAGCPNSWSLRLRSMLFEQNSRYRSISIAVTGSKRNIGKEHKAMLDAALSRDADAAVEIMTKHILLTTDALVKLMSNKPELLSSE